MTTKKDTYNTYGMSLSPMGITLYCYNSNLISIYDLITIEHSAFRHAMQRQHHLFKKFETFETDINLIISLN